MVSRELLQILFGAYLTLSVLPVFGKIELNVTESVGCLGEKVTHWCVGTELVAILWRVLDESGRAVSDLTYTIKNFAHPDQDRLSGEADFGFRASLISASPIKSNMTYTLQKNISNFTVECTDVYISEKKTHTIIVLDAVGVLPRITLSDDTSPSLQISLEESHNPCVWEYNATISKDNDVVYSAIINGTELEVPYNFTVGSYALSVVAENIIGVLTSSEPIYFKVGSPFAPVIEASVEQINNTHGFFSVSWSLNQNVRPVVETVYVQLGDTTVNVDPDISSLNATVQNSGEPVSVKVWAANSQGNSSESSLTIDAGDLTESPVPTKSSLTAQPTSFLITPSATIATKTPSVPSTPLTQRPPSEADSGGGVSYAVGGALVLTGFLLVLILK